MPPSPSFHIVLHRFFATLVGAVDFPEGSDAAAGAAFSGVPRRAAAASSTSRSIASAAACLP